MPSAARTGTDGIMKFHGHVGRLQQVAHQPAENLSCFPCVYTSGTKGPALAKKSAAK
jgi:hypothetical protein